MKLVTNPSRPAAPRSSPLMFDACRCSPAHGLCLTCARFLKYEREVKQRQADWARWGGR